MKFPISFSRQRNHAMEIKKSTITKIETTGPGLCGPVTILLDSVGHGAGRVTLESMGASWAAYWGNIGSRPLAEFFCDCDIPYLAGKFDRAYPTVYDAESFKNTVAAKMTEIYNGSDCPWDYNQILAEVDLAHFERPEDNATLWARILGDEWDALLPVKANPKYERLCEVIHIAQKAVAEATLQPDTVAQPGSFDIVDMSAP